MAYKFPKQKLNENGLFGPTSRKHFYMPVGYHNKTAASNPDKNKWVLKKGEQFEVFKLSDENVWECKSNKGLFSILSNGEEILGVNEEGVHQKVWGNLNQIFYSSFLDHQLNR